MLYTPLKRCPWLMGHESGRTLICTVHDNDGAVHCCQRAERIFGKVLMARGVQDIHFVIPVVEFHDGSRNRNTALFFDFHPVAGGRFLDFVVLDGTGHLDLPAEEQ